MDEETECKRVNWIQPLQDMVQWIGFINAVINL
jgi:hypothetical protein